MTTKRVTLREARATLPAILKAGKPVAIGDGSSWGDVRGYIVPLPEHQRWSEAARTKAEKAALRNLRAAIANR